jgi:hypothetical protein
MHMRRLVFCLLFAGCALLVYLAITRRGAPAVRFRGAPGCGQYAIYNICARHGVTVSMQEVMNLAPPRPEGNSLFDLAEALKRIGFGRLAVPTNASPSVDCARSRSLCACFASGAGRPSDD